MYAGCRCALEDSHALSPGAAALASGAIVGAVPLAVMPSRADAVVELWNGVARVKLLTRSRVVMSAAVSGALVFSAIDFCVNVAGPVM